MADKSANKPKKGAHLIKKQAPKPEKPAQAVRTEAKQPKKKRRVPIGVKIAVGVVIAAAAGAFVTRKHHRGSAPLYPAIMKMDGGQTPMK